MPSGRHVGASIEPSRSILVVGLPMQRHSLVAPKPRLHPRPTRPLVIAHRLVDTVDLGRSFSDAYQEDILPHIFLQGSRLFLHPLSLDYHCIRPVARLACRTSTCRPPPYETRRLVSLFYSYVSSATCNLVTSVTHLSVSFSTLFRTIWNI
nr:hypothetical protein CFP56_11761 [Quercus suber]